MSFGRLNRGRQQAAIGAFKTVASGLRRDSHVHKLAACTNLALPFGGHKGSAVAMIEVLSGCLSSGNFGASAEGIADGKFLGPSHFVLAIGPQVRHR